MPYDRIDARLIKRIRYLPYFGISTGGVSWRKAYCVYPNGQTQQSNSHGYCQVKVLVLGQEKRKLFRMKFAS